MLQATIHSYATHYSQPSCRHQLSVITVIVSGVVKYTTITAATMHLHHPDYDS